jgi:hypothetical protein
MDSERNTKEYDRGLQCEGVTTTHTASEVHKVSSPIGRWRSSFVATLRLSERQGLTFDQPKTRTTALGRFASANKPDNSR